MTPLCKIANKYGTDKGPMKHNYTPVYYELFYSKRKSVSCVCEIGVAQGKSIEMWLEFFTKATIVGVDADEDCVFSVKDNRYEPILGNSYHEYTCNEIKKYFYDIIIDDGSHQSKHIIHSFYNLFQNVKQGGYYIIEDLDAKKAKSALKYLQLVENHPNLLPWCKIKSIKIHRNKLCVIQKG